MSFPRCNPRSNPPDHENVAGFGVVGEQRGAQLLTAHGFFRAYPIPFQDPNRRLSHEITGPSYLLHIHLLFADIDLVGVLDNHRRCVPAKVSQRSERAQENPIEAIHHCRSLIHGFGLRHPHRERVPGQPSRKQ